MLFLCMIPHLLKLSPPKMVASEAFLHKLSFSHSYDLQTFKTSLALGLPKPKPKQILFIWFCSRKPELENMQSYDRQRNRRVFEHESLVKRIHQNQSKHIKAKLLWKDNLSKPPPDLFMSQKFEASLNHMSKWIATTMFIVFLVWKYDGECLWLATGSVANYITCLKLKRVMKQDRALLSAKSDPGMPSSHAQSIFYIFSTILLSSNSSLSLSALGFVCASYLSWLRVSQQFHTRSQVIVGGAVGLLFSIVWHRSWHSYVMDAFISVLWVRVAIIFGAATFFLGYLLNVIHHAYNIQNHEI